MIILWIFIPEISNPMFLAIAASYYVLSVPLFIVFELYNKNLQLTMNNYGFLRKFICYFLP
jgi:predicted transporter